MAYQDGSVGAEPYPGSIIDRIRTTPRETFWRRLLIWGVVLVLVSIGFKLLLNLSPRPPNPFLLMSIFVLATGAGLGMFVYYFARFIPDRELRFLLAATAFSALGGGSTLQAIADFRAPASSPHNWLITAAWFVSSIFFVGAAFSESAWRPAGRNQAVGHVVVGLALVVAFPLSALPYALDVNLLHSLGSTAIGNLACYIVDVTASILSPLMLTLALFGFHRRMRSDHDRVAGLLCYFLITCAIGLVYHAASGARFDDSWAIGQLLFAVAWIVLLAGVEVESAFAHRDASDRLKELESLHEVSWSLVGAGNCRELLGTLARILVDKFGVKIAGVYLADRAGENLELVAACGRDELCDSLGSKYAVASTDRRPGFHSGHTVKAFTSKQVHTASDVFVDVEFVPWQVIAVDDGCAVSIPLVNQGVALGVLDLYFGQSSELTRQRLELLATIAASATPAVQNAIAREQFAQDPAGNELDAAA